MISSFFRNLDAARYISFAAVLAWRSEERCIMSTRQEKVQELLREEIADILRREFKDPRLGFITVIDTEVTPDMRHAKVYVSIMGSEKERKDNMAILKNAQWFVRQAFMKRVRMKTVPEIEFVLDTSVDKGIRLLELFEQIKSDEPKTES